MANGCDGIKVLLGVVQDAMPLCKQRRSIRGEESWAKKITAVLERKRAKSKFECFERNVSFEKSMSVLKA